MPAKKKDVKKTPPIISLPPAQGDHGKALRDAVRSGDLRQVEVLIAAGHAINRRDKMGRTPLMIAAIYNRGEIVKHLLSLPKIKIEIYDERGRTAIMHAVQKKRLDIVKILRGHEHSSLRASLAGKSPDMPSALVLAITAKHPNQELIDYLKNEEAHEQQVAAKQTEAKLTQLSQVSLSDSSGCPTALTSPLFSAATADNKRGSVQLSPPSHGRLPFELTIPDSWPEKNNDQAASTPQRRTPKAKIRFSPRSKEADAAISLLNQLNEQIENANQYLSEINLAVIKINYLKTFPQSSPADIYQCQLKKRATLPLFYEALLQVGKLKKALKIDALSSTDQERYQSLLARWNEYQKEYSRLKVEDETSMQLERERKKSNFITKSTGIARSLGALIKQDLPKSKPILSLQEFLSIGQQASTSALGTEAALLAQETEVLQIKTQLKELSRQIKVIKTRLNTVLAAGFENSEKFLSGSIDLEAQLEIVTKENEHWLDLQALVNIAAFSLEHLSRVFFASELSCQTEGPFSRLKNILSIYKYELIGYKKIVAKQIKSGKTSLAQLIQARSPLKISDDSSELLGIAEMDLDLLSSASTPTTTRSREQSSTTGDDFAFPLDSKTRKSPELTSYKHIQQMLPRHEIAGISIVQQQIKDRQQQWSAVKEKYSELLSEATIPVAYDTDQQHLLMIKSRENLLELRLLVNSILDEITAMKTQLARCSALSATSQFDIEEAQKLLNKEEHEFAICFEVVNAAIQVKTKIIQSLVRSNCRVEDQVEEDDVDADYSLR